MQFTESDLDTLSTLARIDIKSEEKQKMLADMQAILGYISEINDVEGHLEKSIDTHHNITREDIVTRGTGSNTKALLGEAPATEGEYVKVEQVFK